MPSIFADRMAVLGTETAFEVLAKAKALERQGKDIVHLEIGEPDFDTPKNIKEAAVKALYSGYTHYVPAAGIPELRETIAEYISKTRKIPADPEEVVVTPGAKPIMFFAILACVNHGEEVLYPNPGFPIYESMINFIGAKPVPIPLKEENDFRLDHEYVKRKITKKTKMIILNSPENPTGGVLTREDLKVIADCIANRDDVIVLSDEIYSRIIYEGEHQSIASLPGMKEKTILLDGFSKTYAMTGWRLGYGVMRKDLAQKIAQLMVNSNSCTCSFIQMAGVEALKGPQDAVDRMVAEFRKRRETIVSGLNKIKGITCKKPIGAFYVFPNITGTGMKSKELSDYLLNEAGVAVLPGTSFGKYGEGYLRISFANSVENINKALNRISQALKNL
ncbi:MAG: pyridoxal phosphate-dependent aminotransferase [Candidatus Bathyarchaeota archaeon]|jgi:aspartate/methionine/tyrosine aminotransferase|nr:pyridoxal phosphate-dependent aminotransferase [Candidatus Bathyarchaeota archaeon A05DMB-3]MDH7607286.1 pyridoxal phosphate-dependent aminotransferase [Candidatus Bathyarchaeota archaeon]